MADLRDDALIAELRDLAGWLEVPEAPSPAPLAARVVSRLRAPRRAVWWRWWEWSGRAPRWRALVAAVAAVVCVVALVPPARATVVDAVSGLLRFAGVEIRDEPGPGSLPATPSPLPSVRSAALDEARRVARFPVRAPLALGVPDSVELADPDPGGAPRVVTLIYRGGTVRLDQLDGHVRLGFVKQSQTAEFTTVSGEFAVWIPGPHPVTYVDRDGREQTATARLAGPTLIWFSDAVTYRLEGVATVQEAVTIAESMT